MTPRLRSLIVSRPWLTLACFTLALGAVASGVRNVEIDRSLDAVIQPDDPVRPLVEAMKDRFGSDEIVVVALRFEDVFAPEALAKIAELTHALEALDGVDDVRSLATARHVEATPAGSVRVGPLFRDPPRTAAEADEVRRRVLDDPLLMGNLVSESGQAAALVVFFDRATDLDAHRQFDATVAVEETAKRIAAPAPAYVSGVPVNKVANAHAARGDLLKVIPLLLVANAIILAVLHRSLLGLLVPVLAILATVIGTLGVMGHMGVPLNTFTNLVPALLIMLAAAYSVHVMTAYYQAVGDARLQRGVGQLARAGVVDDVLGRMGRPVLVVVVTTCIAFGSIGMNPVPAASQLGVFTAVGTLLLLPICLVLVPALLRVVQPPRRRVPGPSEAPAQGLWRFLADLAWRRPWAIIATWIALTAVALVGTARIEIATNALEFLHEEHPLRVSERMIQAELGATAVLNVYLDAGGEDAAVEPEALERLARLEAFVGELPETDRTLTLLDLIEPMQIAFLESMGEPTEPGPHGRVLPQSYAEAAELLMLYSYPQDLERYIDDERAMLRMIIRMNERSSVALNRVRDQVLDAAPELGIARGDVEVASTLYLMGRSFDQIASMMVLSILLSVVLITPALMLLSGSVRAGLFAMAPNLIPPIFVFAFMGWFGYRLDFSNSTVVCITLGIAVDDTVHLLAKFRHEQQAGARGRDVILRALQRGGPAMLFSTGVLAVSLLIFNVSSFQPVVHLGQIAAFGFAVCLLTDLTLYPAILALCQRRHDGAPDRSAPVPPVAEPDLSVADSR